MLKQLIYLIILFSSNITALSQNPILKDFSISGKLENGQSGQYIYISYYNAYLKKPITDSSIITSDNKILFEGVVGMPAVAFINKFRSKIVDSSSMMIFIEPGKMMLKFDYSNFNTYTVLGSTAQKQYEKLENQKAYWYVQLSKNHNALEKTSYKEKIKLAKEKVQQINLDFIKKNPESIVSLYQLNLISHKVPPALLFEFFNILSNNLQHHPIGVQLKSRIISRLNATPGKHAENITGIDFNGNAFNLNSYKGKFILLDFWASWCVPCRKEIPKLLTIYSMFKNKSFEVVSISTDEDQQKWKSAILNDNSFVWKNLKSNKQKNNIAAKFGVNILPTKILLDTNGIIISRWEGSEENALTDLHNFLKNNVKQ